MITSRSNHIAANGIILFFIMAEQYSIVGFPGGSVGKESTCSGGDLGLIPGL